MGPVLLYVVLSRSVRELPPETNATPPAYEQKKKRKKEEKKRRGKNKSKK